LSGALALVVTATACRDRAPSASAEGAPSPAVTVTYPVAQQVREQIDVTGTVSPSATVTLVARVQGELKAIGFTDGSNVRKGQLLFRIEPDTYRAQLTYDQASLDNANQELARQKEMAAENATSQSNLQKAQTTRDQAVAKRDMSRINLNYTEIRAPFAGRIGARTVDVGNLVGASDTAKLATLDRIQPAYVDFTLNERDARRLGLFKQDPARRVLVTLPGGKSGETVPLDFVDTRVDQGSGALRMRATVPNHETQFVPGMSVEVHIPASEPQTVLLVPETAISRDQAGASVLVVNPASVVEKRMIATAGLYGTQRAVTAGMTPGDRVVTGGAISVTPGSHVRIASTQQQGRS
jgi:RND family efflux transporter MFP subunit